jgi:UDP-N-acetylglucosamine transferase subunit ALG13
MGEQEKTLFVASTGGHLAQLVRLSTLMNASADSLWVTFRSPQSESLLAGRRVLFVPYIRSRDLGGVIRTSRIIRRLLATERFDRAISTGAAIAVAALPIAKMHGIPTEYVESVSRVRGPSLSGRIIAATRSARLFSQHPGWATGRWKYRSSIFGTYRTAERAPSPAPSLFVTLGTIEGYRFDSLIEAVMRTGLADERTVWQVGHTGRTELPGVIAEQFDAGSFATAARAADVVISHAGVGTILELLDLGIAPVVVPRRRARQEHVDDHQEQIAGLLKELDLAVVVEAPDLTADHVRAAARRTVIAAETTA